MAFRSLTDAECGQINPLAQLTSHITQDKAFLDTQGQIFSSSSDQLVEQFLEEARAVPQTFRMDDLMREMHEIESQKSALPPVPASAIKDHLHDNVWAQQYIQQDKVFEDNSQAAAIWAEISTEEQLSLNPELKSRAEWLNKVSNMEDLDETQRMNPHRFIPPWNPYAAGPSTNNEFAQQYLKDGKVFHSGNHEEIWAEISSQEKLNNLKLSGLAPDVEEDLLTHAEDSKFIYSKFMNFMQNVKDGEAEFDSGKMTEKEAQNWCDEFIAGNKPDVSQTWSNPVAEHEQFWNNLQEEMKKADESTKERENPWLSEFAELGDSSAKEYKFREENPMADLNNPLEKGKALRDEGDLPSAVLCFEAAVQKEPENSEAWLLLGITQAENEKDPSAIPALKSCLKIEPNNLQALMALAVSYTNESYYHQACDTLIAWLKNNPKYGDLVPSLNFTGDKSNLTQDLFIKAAQRNPTDVDYEIQCGLGVLFNLTGDHDKAADCFRSALSVQPDDARLWNKLGATLANGSKPEQAVEAYYQALKLSPGFIRARYNVGITCINLNAYREAAEHFLTALNQQAKAQDAMQKGKKSHMSDTIWSTLRMCVSLMNRSDLRYAVDKKDLEELNKALEISEN